MIDGLPTAANRYPFAAAPSAGTDFPLRPLGFQETPLSVDASLYDEYAGEYRGEEFTIRFVRMDGQLVGQSDWRERWVHRKMLFVPGPDAVFYSDLVRYPLSLAGVSCAIIGTGQISRDKPEGDQMVANLAAAFKDIPSELERRRIEKDAETRHGAATNYFQEKTSLIQPAAVNVKRDGERVIVEWNTAIAGPDPIRSYEILSGDRLLLSLPYRPQLTEAPLSASLPASAIGEGAVKVLASIGPPRRPASL